MVRSQDLKVVHKNMKNMIIALMVTSVLLTGTVSYGAPMTDRAAKASAKEKDKDLEQQRVRNLQSRYKSLVRQREQIVKIIAWHSEHLPQAEKDVQQAKEDIATLKKRVSDAETALKEATDQIKSAEERTSAAIARADAATAKLSPKTKR